MYDSTKGTWDAHSKMVGPFSPDLLFKRYFKGSTPSPHTHTHTKQHVCGTVCMLSWFLKYQNMLSMNSLLWQTTQMTHDGSKCHICSVLFFLFVTFSVLAAQCVTSVIRKHFQSILVSNISVLSLESFSSKQMV